MTRYSPVSYDATVFPEARDFPVMLDAELSAKCNPRCSFCHLNWLTLEKIDQFDTETFEKQIVPALSKIKALTLFRNYEPLTCRDFVPIMRRIAEFELEETYFSSNGLLLRENNTDAIIGNLFEETIEQIWHGPRMEAFRSGVNNPDAMNRDCRNCPHCRLGSMSQNKATNFNKSDTYIGGLKRFHEGPARRVRGKAPG
ncbi:MAG: SPASM domain-containing protein [Rhodospirillales bacterium]|nr:SPASM domain-containing protein [Rhodospirillales bacterium]